MNISLKNLVSMCRTIILFTTHKMATVKANWVKRDLNSNIPQNLGKGMWCNINLWILLIGKYYSFYLPEKPLLLVQYHKWATYHLKTSLLTLKEALILGGKNSLNISNQSEILSFYALRRKEEKLLNLSV